MFTPCPTPQSLATGQLGSDLLSTTDSYSGNWGVIYCLSNCTFTTLTTDSDFLNGATTPGLDGISLTAGQIIWGHYTVIKLASGAVKAYRSIPS